MVNTREILTRMESILYIHKVWIDFITAIGAIIFSMWQIKINLRLKKLQDFVAISAVLDTKNKKIKLLNTGKIDLYLYGIKITNEDFIKFDKPRLITSGTLDASYYWLDIPNVFKQSEFPWNFDVILYLMDGLGKRWISEHGGVAQRMDDGGIQIIVWSHATYKKFWKLK